MTKQQIAALKELYFQHPEISAKEAAKKLKMGLYETLSAMKKLGYTAEKHAEARKLFKMGMKIPKPIMAKEKVEKKPAVSVPNCFGHMPSPEKTEHRKQKALNKKSNDLLAEAEKAASEGDIDRYMKLRKEYELAARQAEAYQNRGRLKPDEKTTYGLENQYQICR